MKVGIYSFCTSDLNPEIPFYQKEVFKKLNLNISQYIEDPIYDPHRQHGYGINKIIKESNFDYIIIFDIDCIPLNGDFYKKICTEISDNNTLSGARGSSGNDMRDYVHAGFFGFSKKLYYDCGMPTMEYFTGDYWGDTSQKFTDTCIRLNKNIKYWEITGAIDNVFYIPSINKHFGHGTVYENLIYHQFEISSVSKFSEDIKFKKNQEMFINKCKQIISS